MKLTKTTVEALPIPGTESSIFWDDELSGFGVRVWSSGKRSYIVQGRANGKSRRVVIGQHGKPLKDNSTLTADKARKLAMGLIADFSKDIDPVIEKQRKETLAVTLQDVCDVYLKERRTAKGGELTTPHQSGYCKACSPIIWRLGEQANNQHNPRPLFCPFHRAISQRPDTSEPSLSHLARPAQLCP